MNHKVQLLSWTTLLLRSTFIPHVIFTTKLLFITFVTLTTPFTLVYTLISKPPLSKSLSNLDTPTNLPTTKSTKTSTLRVLLGPASPAGALPSPTSVPSKYTSVAASWNLNDAALGFLIETPAASVGLVLLLLLLVSLDNESRPSILTEVISSVGCFTLKMVSMRMRIVTARIRRSAAEQPQHLRQRWRRCDMSSSGGKGLSGFSCSLLSSMAEENLVVALSFLLPLFYRNFFVNLKIKNCII